MEAAVAKLRADGHDVAGAVCHVGKQEDRENLFKVMREIRAEEYYPFSHRRLSVHLEVWTFLSQTLPSIPILVCFVLIKLKLKYHILLTRRINYRLS